jgi:hypothetical protein
MSSCERTTAAAGLEWGDDERFKARLAGREPKLDPDETAT